MAPDHANTMSYEPNTPIPTGSWSLWYHSPTETKWTPSTYQQVATMNTFGEFWAIKDALSDEAVLNGFFFLMRDPLPPLWENKGNIRGGSYSMRIARKDSNIVYEKYMLAAMLNEAATDKRNKITGVCISPKKGFNIITIWNEDFTDFQEPTDIHLLHHELKYEEVRYTRNVDKKFN
jgi:hypothetical protein